MLAFSGESLYNSIWNLWDRAEQNFKEKMMKIYMQVLIVELNTMLHLSKFLYRREKIW